MNDSVKKKTKQKMTTNLVAKIEIELHSTIKENIIEKQNKTRENQLANRNNRRNKTKKSVNSIQIEEFGKKTTDPNKCVCLN